MPRKTTRAAQGGGTIRQRKDGRWEARYTIGRHAGTGKQMQKSIYGDTQSEVRKKLVQLIAAIDEGTYIEPAKITVYQWFDTWLEDFCGDIKPYTRKSYGEHIKKHIKPAIGAVKLSALTTAHIQKLYNAEQKSGLSPKTIKNLHGVIHRALQQAVDVGYIARNPSDACKLPRVEKPDIKPLNDNQITAFLEAIKGDSLERLFLVDVFTGLRLGEIIGLTWEHVDFNKGIICICRQLQRQSGVYVFETLKNNKARTITPAPFIMQALKDQKKEQSLLKLQAGNAWNNNKNLVFTNNIGGNLVPLTVYKHFKRIAASIGVPDARFHDLRHSYAVAALKAGDDIKTVQEALGHHTAAFTLDVYGHVTEEMKRESAARMEAYIQRLKG